MGLSYCRKIGIFHRDLKLQNILLSDKTPDAVLKIADFGLAKDTSNQQEDLFETQVGTPIYMAPEIQKKQTYTSKSDLWSLGVILFELLTGIPPFIGKTRE